MSILQNKTCGVNQINALSVFNFMLLCCWLMPALAQPSAEKWQLEAQRLQLSTQQGWLNLLHAETNIWAETESQVDDDDFFLSANGKQDMRAELVATLNGFFDLSQTPAVQCRFPARFYWLQQQLKHVGEMPFINCKKFIEWRDKVAANKVTLAFPSMYLNNPGSMFGHTFLRLDNNKKSPLLSYTLSYTARTDETDSFPVYAYKGITGGYQGYFTTRPYYETVQEYGDIEHRDIWEYDLDLNQQEVNQMIRHLWELSGMNFDYFFLRENCAYRLLAILDVARPNLNLLQKNKFPMYAIPVDTVRAIINEGIVKDTHYRPAISSRLQQMQQQLDAESLKKAVLLADKKISTKDILSSQKDVTQQAKTLQLASEIRQFKKQNDDDILLARSQLNVTQEQAKFTFQSEPPQQAHDSARLSVALGKEEKKSIVDFSIRTAFHDLLDRPNGFLEGIAITGLGLTARWFADEEKLKLQKFKFFSMTSLSPITPWSNPLSGKLTVSMQRYALKNNDVTPFEVSAGLGWSKKISSLLVYGLGSTALHYNSRIDDNGSVFLGTEIGTLWQLQHSRFYFRIEQLASVLGGVNRKVDIEINYQYDISRKQSMKLSWLKREYQNIRASTASLNYLYYF